jgi:hypothetical protein
MNNSRLKGTIDDVRGRVRGASDDLSEFAESQARRLSATAGDRLNDAYSQVRHAARGASEGAFDVAGDAYDRGGQYLQSVNKMTADRLGDNVLPALLLAGAAGYALSYIVHRRQATSRAP